MRWMLTFDAGRLGCATGGLTVERRRGTAAFSACSSFCISSSLACAWPFLSSIHPWLSPDLMGSASTTLCSSFAAACGVTVQQQDGRRRVNPRRSAPA
eukprot:CAMPEP_0180245468 /NCGR_PEP_ID=MMETSP0987-20121128/35022_1 /TAXON_ID=697907 /ORGANISM="non described non described, Strain CCMP2293" /LENGTH=97 /DNA_ID=CAMNT_0022213149 /DNA_START=14 /DNA_END=308 /DNA_ORIENTATION=+